MANTPRMSNNCPNSDMFGSQVNHDQHSQDSIQESRTHNANNITCDFPTNYTTHSTTLIELLSVYMLP